MNNLIVAKELVKIAKSLVAGNSVGDGYDEERDWLEKRGFKATSYDSGIYLMKNDFYEIHCYFPEDRNAISQNAKKGKFSISISGKLFRSPIEAKGDSLDSIVSLAIEELKDRLLVQEEAINRKYNNEIKPYQNAISEVDKLLKKVQ